MSKIDLSIIYVNFNSYTYLRESIKSVYASSFPKNKLEIIVIDNASKEDCVGKIRKEFTDVKVIGSRNNLGFAKANNKGIKKAQGKYILLLNPDTIIENDTLKILFAFMEKNNKA